MLISKQHPDCRLILSRYINYCLTCICKVPNYGIYCSNIAELKIFDLQLITTRKTSFIQIIGLSNAKANRCPLVTIFIHRLLVSHFKCFSDQVKVEEMSCNRQNMDIIFGREIQSIICIKAVNVRFIVLKLQLPSSVFKSIYVL